MFEDVRRFSDLRDLLKARRDAETRTLLLGAVHRYIDPNLESNRQPSSV